MWSSKLVLLSSCHNLIQILSQWSHIHTVDRCVYVFSIFIKCLLKFSLNTHAQKKSIQLILKWERKCQRHNSIFIPLNKCTEFIDQIIVTTIFFFFWGQRLKYEKISIFIIIITICGWCVKTAMSLLLTLFSDFQQLKMQFESACFRIPITPYTNSRR